MIGCSVPPLTQKQATHAKRELPVWPARRDSIRATAVAWSLAVTTVHRTVALCRSSFESLPSDFNEKIKGSTLRHYLLFFGGEQGIRTLEAVLRLTRVPVVLLRPARTTLHMLYCLAIIHEWCVKIKSFYNLFLLLICHSGVAVFKVNNATIGIS